MKIINIGVKDFYIEMDAPPGAIFKPGDVISGAVILNTSPDEDFKYGMTLTLFGKSHVEWNNTEGAYKANETLLENSQTFLIAAGESRNNFSMLIPSSEHLPRSITLEEGSIEYGVKAHIKRSLIMRDLTASVLINLRPELSPRSNLSSEPSLEYFRNAVKRQTKDSKVGVYSCSIPLCCIPLCGCYLSHTKVKMRLSIESLWAYPGVGFPYFFHIHNSNTSKSLENVRIQLIEETILLSRKHGRLEYVRIMSRPERVISEETLSLNISPGEELSRHGLFLIPKDAARNPSLIHSSIIRVAHKLRAVVKTIKGYSGRLLWPAPAVQVQVDLVIATLTDQVI